jgi:hypothetical protein
MATTTPIAKSKLKGCDPRAAAVEYLRTEKRWREGMLDSIADVTLEGNDYRVAHAPMPRHRILMPLSEAFCFGSPEEHEARAEEWKQSYLAVAEDLGLCVDTTCQNPSRLMYRPRRPKGSAERKTIFVKGRALDLSEFKSKLTISPTPLGTAEPWEPKTARLLKFLAEQHDFDAVHFLLDGRPDDKIRRNKKRQHVIRCPNEASHTDRDPRHLATDTACVVDNARGKHGWMLLCQHAGCGFDRAKLLDIECQNRGITDASKLLGWCKGHAPEEVPSWGPAEDAKAIDKLAKMSPLEFARVKDQWAEKMGVKASELKEAVKKRRGELKDESKSGPLAEPEPWPDKVDGAALLDELVKQSKRYLILQPNVAEAMALWAVHAHAFDAFEHSQQQRKISPLGRGFLRPSVPNADFAGVFAFSLRPTASTFGTQQKRKSSMGCRDQRL